MMGAAGTRERIVAAARYHPKDFHRRETRIVDGKIQTFKRAGDVIITSTGKHEVTQDGWY